MQGQHTTTFGRVRPDFARALREAGLHGAIIEIPSSRFIRYIMQPKHLLRDGWLLARGLQLEQKFLRAYELGRGARVGQRLTIDRDAREATLLTHDTYQTQVIKVGLLDYLPIEDCVFNTEPDRVSPLYQPAIVF